MPVLKNLLFRLIARLQRHPGLVAGLLQIGLTLAHGAGGWLARTWVPPATLWLTGAAVVSQLDSRKARRVPASNRYAKRGCLPTPRSMRRAGLTSGFITSGDTMAS